MAVEQGQRHGYTFTTEEVAQAIAATQLPDGNAELSDHQLEAVAGGNSKVESAGPAVERAGRAVGDTLGAGLFGAVGFLGGLFGG